MKILLEEKHSCMDGEVLIYSQPSCLRVREVGEYIPQIVTTSSLFRRKKAISHSCIHISQENVLYTHDVISFSQFIIISQIINKSNRVYSPPDCSFFTGQIAKYCTQNVISSTLLCDLFHTLFTKSKHFQCKYVLPQTRNRSVEIDLYEKQLHFYTVFINK